MTAARAKGHTPTASAWTPSPPGIGSAGTAAGEVAASRPATVPADPVLGGDVIQADAAGVRPLALAAVAHQQEILASAAAAHVQAGRQRVQQSPHHPCPHGLLHRAHSLPAGVAVLPLRQVDGGEVHAGPVVQVAAGDGQGREDGVRSGGDASQPIERHVHPARST